MKKILKKSLVLVTVISMFTAMGIIFSSTVQAEENLYDENSWDTMGPAGTESLWEFNTTDSYIRVDAKNQTGLGDMLMAIKDSDLAVGEYEYSAKIDVLETGSTNEVWIGIVPWYIDGGNFIYASLKYVKNTQGTFDFMSYVIHGMYNGQPLQVWEGNWNSRAFLDNWFDGTMAAYKQPLDFVDGHTLKSQITKNEFGDTLLSLFYNGNQVVQYTLNGYSNVASPKVGYLAFNAEVKVSDITVNDITTKATDWTASDGWIYKGVTQSDWTYDGDTDKWTVNSENSGYRQTRAFTTNDQGNNNYYVSTEINEVSRNSSKTEFRYGLLPWYKDEANYIVSWLQFNTDTDQMAVVMTGELNGMPINPEWTDGNLPQDFDITSSHQLKVVKKNTQFEVLVDDVLIVTQNYTGTEENYFVGLEAENATVEFTNFTIGDVYDPYDPIVQVDSNGNEWTTTGKSETAWTWSDDKLTIDATDVLSGKVVSGYTDSEVNDNEIDVSATFNAVSLDTTGEIKYALMPWRVDGNNYIFAGIVKDLSTDKVFVKAYGRVKVEESETTTIIDESYEITDSSAIDFNSLTLKVEKNDAEVKIFVDNNELHVFTIENTDTISSKTGISVAGTNVEITNYQVDGYRSYDEIQIGDWYTKGRTKEEWVINDNTLVVDARFVEGKDFSRIRAYKEIQFTDNYEISVNTTMLNASGNERKYGITVWYLNQDNYIEFWLDMWSDNQDPRTTITGRINGQDINPTWTHGPWMPEVLLEVENTLTVRVTGNDITAYVNDIEMLSHTINEGLTVPQGQTLYAGVDAFSVKAEFTDFSVSEYNEPVDDPGDDNDDNQDTEGTEDTDSEGLSTGALIGIISGSIVILGGAVLFILRKIR